MKIRTTDYGTVVITADLGMVLLGLDNGTSEEIWLAKSDRPENYIEIPKDEIDNYVKEETILEIYE